MSWFSSNYERTSEAATAECEAANCDGDMHFTDHKDPVTNEDIEIGLCPNWKEAAA